jgi:hypothetical protein
MRHRWLLYCAPLGHSNIAVLYPLLRCAGTPPWQREKLYRAACAAALLWWARPTLHRWLLYCIPLGHSNIAVLYPLLRCAGTPFWQGEKLYRAACAAALLWWARPTLHRWLLYCAPLGYSNIAVLYPLLRCAGTPFWQGEKLYRAACAAALLWWARPTLHRWLLYCTPLGYSNIAVLYPLLRCAGTPSWQREKLYRAACAAALLWWARPTLRAKTQCNQNP